MTSSKPAILVVDDEEAILETMTFTFERDYEVLTARSAREGLALLERHPEVAAVITDQRMPETTGVEFLARVCELHPSTTRIILTGFADLDAIARAINEGHVYAYVSKPWEPDEFKHLVRRAVDHHRLLLENERLVSDLRNANLFLEAAMDEIPMGALAADAAGVLRAVNRLARDYLGLSQDPRGARLEDVAAGDPLALVREAVHRLGEAAVGEYEELELATGGCPLRLRVGVRTLADDTGGRIGRVILLREISHEPLRRRFEEVVREVGDGGEGLRWRLERAMGALEKLRSEVRGSRVASPDMAELGERVSRTLTAFENCLSVDEALAGNAYPDARRLVERMRLAISRWPLPDAIPERVRELARRVETYYETGENPGTRVL